MDNDCDGQIDDGKGMEICDGIDNNANGAVDESCVGSYAASPVERQKGVPSTKMCVNSTASITSGNLNHDQYLHRPDFQMFYNSLSDYSGPLGKGWTHDYNMNISEDNGSSLALMLGGGNKVYFWPTSGVYYPEARSPEFSSIVKNADGTYTRTMKEGIVYTFDASGKLASITDRNGNSTTLAYTGGDLTSVTDSVGRTVQLTYDAGHRIIQFTSVDSKVTALSYDVNGQLASITDPAGGAWSYTYDASGRMLTKTDPVGNITTYAYDAQGKMTSARDPQGTVKSFSYSQATDTATIAERDGGIWTFKYDPVLDVVLEKTDPDGNLTQYTYDTDRNLRQKINPDNTASTYDYDAEGNMITEINELGYAAAYTYNSFGQVETITDPQDGITAYVYDANGNMLSATDPGGAVTQYEYDARGNLTKITGADNNETIFEWYPNDDLLAVTEPSGARTSFTYDAAGNLWTSTDANGAVTTFEYDAVNRLTRITEPGNAITQYDYDANGNLIRVTDANGKVTEYTYNPNNLPATEKDPLNNVTTYSYESAGCGSCGGGGVNKLTSLKDARNNSTSFSYDRRGNVTSETDPLGNVTSFGYDTRSRLASRTDANNATISYTYDGLGRLTGKTFPDMTTATFGYDSLNRMTTAANQHISYTFAYDANGRVTSVVDSNGRTISYVYDSRGNRARMTTPGGVIDYTYDQNGRLSHITPSGGQPFIFSYDPGGGRSSLAYPNGVVADYTYNGRNALTGITYADSASAVVDSFSYTLDNTDNRTQKTDTEYQFDYAYDPAYRVTQSQPTEAAPSPIFTQSTEGFTYDAVGNRQTGPSNPREAASFSYQYDYEHRLTQAVKVSSAGTDTVTFKYDPFGRRIEKSVATIEDGLPTTYKYTYVYDNEDIILEVLERTQDGVTTTTTTSYVHGPGIDEPLSFTREGQTYYYHADGLGSITAVTDANEAVVNRYAYDTFGRVQRAETVRNAYAFTGREYDGETGLYYYRARYYDPEAGRFVSKDPIGFAGGDVNLYGYVSQNPVNWVDPGGLSAIASVRPFAGPLIFSDGPLPVGDMVYLALLAGAGVYDLWHYYNEDSSDDKPSGQGCPVPGAKPGRPTKGKTKQYEKPGSMGTADRDFDSLNPSDVRELPRGGRVGTLPDGRTIVVRPGSTEGRPTIEIQSGRGRIKVRYGN